MKEKFKKISWWIGLAVAVGTAVISYVSTGCTVGRKINVNVDSAFVKSMSFDAVINAKTNKK